MTASAPTKFFELRSKTNRELVSLIGNQLQRGMALVCADDGRVSYELAERALAEVEALLPLLADFDRPAYRRLHVQLAELQEMLHRNTPAMHAHAC